MLDAIRISASVQTPYVRRPSAGTTTPDVLAQAAQAALAEAGLSRSHIDGLGVASFTLAPDRAIDLAVKLGLDVTWIMDSGLGGASGVDMLQHAVAAVRNGDAQRILLVGGDVFTDESFTRLVREYNDAMSQDYGDIQGFGPNVMFALITQLQMNRFGLDRNTYGRLVIRQREGAANNPGAVYREPLTMHEYMDAPVVADPLTILDCVPVVSGACAVIVELDDYRGARNSDDKPAVVIRGLAAHHNADRHTGSGLKTGLNSAISALWERTGWAQRDVTVLALYDDYPAVVIAQLVDAGFLRPDHVASDLGALLDSGVDLNSSGGMLSAGQCGAGAGLHFVVDAVTALRSRDVGSKAVATGYGMVASRYGACSNAVALERVR